MNFDLPTVQNAISTLFGPPSPQQGEANKYLEGFQMSVEAWDLCIHLLRINNQDPFTIQLWTFSAQTLHNKLLRDFPQLDATGQTQLKENMLSLLHLHPNSPPVVTRHLCFAACLLCFQLVSWENSVVEVVKWLESIGANRMVLEFLTGLPEEITRSKGCSLSDEEFRSQCDNVLTKNSQFCLKLLTDYFNSYANQVPTLPSLIFKTLQSWLKSGDIVLDDLFQTPFPQLSFQALQSPDMFEEAVEIICGIIFETREYESSYQFIHQLVIHLNELLANIKQNIDNLDEDNWRGLCRIFVEAGEAWLSLIILQCNEFINIVEGISLCFTHAELEWIGMTFDFWISLARDLEQVPNHPFTPIFQNLVQSTIKHLQYPEDNHEFTAQEKEDFKDFRHEIGDILKDVCILIGPEDTLSIPFNIIKSRMEQGNLDSDPSAWKVLEAPLFSLRCIGSQIPVEHSTILPSILQLFPHLPNNSEIQYTCTLVIARYTPWTLHHPDLIQFQLDYIFAGFDVPNVAPASALALKFLCQDCSSVLGQHFDRILALYEKATALLDKKEILDISEGVAYMVNSLQPQDRFNALVKLIDPLSKKLTPEHFSTVEALAFDIDRTHLFFQITAPESDTDIPHPSAQLIQQVIPLMENVLDKLGDNYHVAEAVGKFFTLVVREYKLYTKDYIPTLIPRLSAAFTKSGLPVYLWVSERIITFHSEYHPSQCLNLTQSISVNMFQRVEAAHFNPNQLPDLMEEYGYLIAANLHRLTQPFIRSDIAASIFRLLFLTPKLQEFHSLQNCLVTWKEFSRAICLAEPPLTPQELQPYADVIDQVGEDSLADLVEGMIFHFADETLHEAVHTTVFTAEIHPERHLVQMTNVITKLEGPNFLPSDRASFITHYGEKIRQRQWREVRSILRGFLDMFHKRNLVRDGNRNQRY